MDNDKEFEFDKKSLINEIDEWLKLSDNQKDNLIIKYELAKKGGIFSKHDDFYRNLIFFSKSSNVLNEIDLEIIFCNGNNELIEIWKYFKIMSSSAVTGDDSFGCIKIMIKDKNTNKYLGIIELGSDIYSCGIRDKYIGWTSENKKEKVEIGSSLYKSKIAYIVNITCCIGLQPMSYNLNIGKLLVMTVFSKEVMDYFYEKRGYYYAGVTTFGLYGKSIQYDRLKEIKYIGETNGNGTCDIPLNIYEKLRDFYKKYFYNDYYKCTMMSSSKYRILQYSLRLLGYDNSLLYHGKKRGIYFGYTINNPKLFFTGGVNDFTLLNSIQSFNIIVNNWKERWGKQRLEHLLNTNRFKVSFELKNFTLKERKNEYAKQYQYEKLNDEIWIRNKKEKSKDYYENNKDKILTLLEYDLSIYDNITRIITPEYCAGFFDADGSVYISNNTLFVNFTQCVLEILLLIQKQYGGEIYERNGKNENQRKQYLLRIVGNKCENILKELSKYSVLKCHKVDKAVEFLNYINKWSSEEKINIINYIKTENKLDDDKYFSRINWKYIAGFFDGDGCITLNYCDLVKNIVNSRFSIAQKYTPNFLNYLNEYISENILNNMSVSKNEISTSKKINIRSIYNEIKNYIIVKKFQYDKMIEILDLYENKNDNIDLIKKLAYLIKDDKHNNVIYNIDLKKENIISSIKSEVLLSIDKDIKKENKNMELKELQSFNKTGLNNPNYGHHLNEQHLFNISIATTKAKRKNNENLTDEKIKEIYALKDTKILQKDVAEKYKMNREIVRRIWNRIILPTDDPDFIQSKMNKITEKIMATNDPSEPDITFEQKISIGKRSLTIDEYITILTWKKKQNAGELLNGKKILSPKLAEHLSTIFNKTISQDIIKNTWSGKTKLYEFEFISKEISYNEYQKLIKKE